MPLDYSTVKASSKRCDTRNLHGMYSGSVLSTKGTAFTLVLHFVSSGGLNVTTIPAEKLKAKQLQETLSDFSKDLSEIEMRIENVTLRTSEQRNAIEKHALRVN